jgi:hypothetical protein
MTGRRKHETRARRRRRRCPTGKIAYRALAEALAAKAEIDARGERIMAAYDCGLCAFFHLTTDQVITGQHEDASASASPWQNACVCTDIAEGVTQAAKDDLTRIARRYRQTITEMLS